MAFAAYTLEADTVFCWVHAKRIYLRAPKPSLHERYSRRCL